MRIAETHGGLAEWTTRETVQANRNGLIRLSASGKKLLLTDEGKRLVKKWKAMKR
jgi:hypothetical protein